MKEFNGFDIPKQISLLLAHTGKNVIGIDKPFGVHNGVAFVVPSYRFDTFEDMIEYIKSNEAKNMYFYSINNYRETIEALKNDLTSTSDHYENVIRAYFI